MEIVGRIAQSATVKKLKDNRQVVNFSIAVNDYYRKKGAAKGVQTTLFINCSYWINTAISDRLIKGSIVELNGRLELNPYKGFDGEAKASLNCHVDAIKIHHSSKAEDAPPAVKPAEQEDLPF
jgi:single-strand DNA-binding protein